ncbi:HAD-like domain-containing protein [Absidia repens]|uniref:Mitochondrial import inner membrane translocase subunit TIM50 n=1 Tax=Absidia repens TaxID=90262 RepID=A0A1X2IPC5_9FUNG|nr:HAD-like domain-containing protein [Absidia repens]
MSPAINKTTKCMSRYNRTKALLKQHQNLSKTTPTPTPVLSIPRAPTPAYLESVDSPQSVRLDPKEAALRKKHLLILDLNGTLLSRTNRRTGMFVRPHIDAFLNYIFDHFKVMVWSSAQAPSVCHMVSLFGEKHKAQLVKTWSRSHFGLSSLDIQRKTPTIKDLTRVWGKFKKYSAHNTVILDDSPSKSVLQPYNSIHLHTFNHNSTEFLTHGDHELLSVMDYLKQLQLQTNIPNFMRNTPYASISPSHLDTALAEESKVCHYYGFYDDLVHTKHDFSNNTTVKVDDQVETDNVDKLKKNTHTRF